jgi:hypothetical protein
MNLQNTAGGRLSSAIETRGAVTNYPVPGSLEGGPEPDYVAYVFVVLGVTIICQ